MILSAINQLDVSVELPSAIRPFDIFIFFSNSILYSLCLATIYSLYGEDGIYSLPFLFTSGFILFHGIGSTILFTTTFTLDMINTNIALLLFVISILVTKFLLNTRYPVINRYRKLYISDTCNLSSADTKLIIFLFTFLALSVFIYYYIMGGAPFYSALKHILYGDINIAKEIIHMGRRSQYYDTSTYMGQGYFELIRIGLLPYLALLFFTKYYNLSFRRKIFSYFAIIMVVLISLASGQRWPTAFFILTFTYLFALLRNSNFFNKKIIISIFFLLTILFLLTYLMNRSSVQYAQGFAIFPAIIKRLFYRITLASHLPAYLTYFVFPDIMGYQMGCTWLQDLLAYLPGPDSTFGVIYSNILGQSWGSAPLTILGELYVNLGLLGPASGFIILGIIITYLQEIFRIKMAADNSFAVDYAIIGIGLIRLCYGSTIGFISNALLPIIFFRLIFLFTKLAVIK